MIIMYMTLYEDFCLIYLNAASRSNNIYHQYSNIKVYCKIRLKFKSCTLIYDKKSTLKLIINESNINNANILLIIIIIIFINYKIFNN